ncbi:hypothetical protein SPRG_19314 [Saprolegnia parasitica CBS 223.65]|uniref:RNA-polymerase II-associated protein 3-like C-terminal domain-containing protein n=1 Tax=Saprolegnia parasitica (strain CBS 223.65) TaxID=695850 RepID=A0A067CWV4_SAPPC|nr:hypothetical protein SPRG_19314 [Saprolegnia parasitica CBS 223.65]KDO33705.1 hypothetical protein SPRG_19314 [Saprolegnia parasitica CBS 223.65]|eukprot:XP_012195726.1 hypothetical protein SPRG_19314 [Saprolegnia parasitica CBS 223.65]
MASIYEGTFDTASLQKELTQALDEDRKYKATDEMKKRAIHTAAGDEAHDPVTSKELQNLSKSERQRNRLYHKKKASLMPATRPATLTGADDGAAPPKSSVEFQRTWQRSCATDAAKLQYLERTTPARLAKLFLAEIDADLFGSIVACLCRSLRAVNPDGEIDAFEAEQVLVHRSMAILAAIGTTRRRSLLLSFLTDAQRDDLSQLLDHLHSVAGDANEALLDLRRLYATP